MLTYIFFLSFFATNPVLQSVTEVQEFTLTNAVNDQAFSLSSLKDKAAVVVIFSSNDCPYDKLYENRIENLLDAYRDRQVAFVLINSNNPERSPEDTPNLMAEKIKELRWNVPYLIDHEQQVAGMFGAQKTPEAFVLKYLNNSFQILYNGSIDDNPQVASDVSNYCLKRALDATLEGQPILVDHTYPTGCMIR